MAKFLALLLFIFMVIGFFVLVVGGFANEPIAYLGAIPFVVLFFLVIYEISKKN